MATARRTMSGDANSTGTDSSAPAETASVHPTQKGIMTKQRPPIQKMLGPRLVGPPQT